MCPNYKNKEVFDGFNEMVEALGGRPLTEEEFGDSTLRNQRTGSDYSAMEAAYKLYHRNNGYFLDKTPNGETSILFQTLLDELGDKKEAIKAKSKVYSDSFKNWFGDWINDPTNASKVVDENGEPLVVYHGSKISNEIRIFYNRPTYFADKFTAFSYTPFTNVENVTEYVYPTFLNIRNPKKVDGKGTYWNNINGMTTDDIVKSVNEEDGVIIRNIKDYSDFTPGNPDLSLNLLEEAPLHTDYVTTNPNQIKSAISNVGSMTTPGFSRTDNDINHNIQYSARRNELTELLISSKLVHLYKGTLFISKTNVPLKEAEEQIFHFLSAFGVPFYTVELYENKESIVVHVDEDMFNRNVKDAINKSEKTDTTLETANRLLSLFPGLRLHNNGKPISKDEAAKLGADKRASAFVKNGVVYFVKGSVVTEDIVIEEILHPFINHIAKTNPELYKSLLYDAIKLFPKLRMQIEKTYDDKHGFTSEDREQELIAQSLSRAVRSEYEQNKPNKYKQYVSKFISWFKSIFDKAFEKSGDFYFADPSKLPQMTLGELAALLNTTDTKFLVNVSDKVRNDISADEEYIAQTLADDTYYQALVHEEKLQYINAHPELDKDEAAKQFDLNKLKECAHQVTSELATEFGVKPYEVRDNDTEITKIRRSIVEFVYECISNPERVRLGIQFIKNAILSPNDITTNVVAIAKEYISKFYSSDAIQTALKELDPSGKQNQEVLINTLAKIVTEDIVQDDKYGNLKRGFWSKLVGSIRKGAKVSYETRKKLFDSIAKAMAYQEDLERTSDNLLHELNYQFEDDKHSNIIKTVNALKRGIKNRIAALQSVSASDVDKLKLQALQTQYDKLQALNLDKNDEVLQIFSQFISDGLTELREASRLLASMEYGNPDDIDGTKLRQIRTDVLGYYKNLIRTSIIPMTRKTEYAELQPGGALYNQMGNIIDQCNRLESKYDYILSVYVNTIADDWVDNNVDIGDKQQFKRNLKLWLNNKINRGDLGFFENWIKSASASHSIVVRMIDDYIRKADTSVRIASIAKGKELYKSYLEFESTLSRFFNPVNKFRSLCEVDNEGFNTGNFVTAVNVGQYEYEEKVLKEELQKELNITIDEEGNLVGDYQNIKEYKDQLDMFYDGYDRKTGTYGKVRKHRPYYAIYYIKRRNMLSEDTMQVIDMLNTDIAALRSKCYDEETGAHITADLHADKAKLDELLRQKQELSSPFKIQYDATGKIIGFTPKSGDELRMANEIRAFNKWLSDVRGFKPNLERYKEVEAKVKAKYGANSIQYKQFVYENTATEISDKYYQEIANLFEKKSMSEDVEILMAERNAIRKAITPKRGYYDPDLSLLTDKAYEKIKEIDEAIDEKRKKSTPKGRNSDEKKKSIKDYLDMQTTEFIVDPVSGIPYIDKLRNEYSAAGKMGEFLYKFYYENKKGELVPLSIFMKTKPNAEYIISDQPAGDFSDMTGIVDDKYNPEDEFLNIDRERYHNDKYDEIMKDPASKQMYENLLSTMEEAWSMIPSINRHYKYQLPQQRDDISSLIIRHKSRNRTSWLKTIGRMCALSAVTATSLGIATVAATWSLSLFPGAAIVGGLLGAVLGITANNNSIWEELTSITERDTSYNENFSVRPDGTEVETIPIRWTKRLADPSAVSTDLLKTVTQFYEMALNYKTKLDLVDKLEDIEYMVHGGFTGTQTTDQEARIKQLLSTYLYGRKKTGISKANSTKMSNFEKKFSKLAALLMSMTHAKLLPWNLTSIAKNLVDSMCSFIVFIGESFVHPIDMVQAIADMGSEIFTGSAFTNITNVDSRSFTAAAMQYNGVAESVGEMFEERAVNPLRRLITRHYSMGPFTFIDYTFKGLFTRMVYNTYRLVTDPNTGQQVFANKEEVKDMYRRCAAVGNDAKLGYKAWKNSDVKLKDAYAVDASTSEFIIKPEFKHLISNKLENRVSNLIKQKTSVINGMLDEADKNKLSTNFIGALMLQMRGWMVSKMVDWTKDGRDFAIYSEDDDLKHTVLGSSGLYQLQSRYLGNFTAQIVQNEDENYRGIYNPATGYIERGWWKGWSRLASNTCNNLKMYVRGIKPNQMYTIQEVRQIRHLALVLITLLAIAFSSYPITKWFERTYKNDKVSKTEQKTAAFAYTATTAAYSERLSEVGPLGFISIALEIVNSPFISNTYLKDINTVVDATNDLIVIINDEVQGKNWKTEELNSDVKRGSFTGLKKYQRNLLKASAQLPGINQFGIANLYKSSEVAPLLEKEKFYRSTIPEWAPQTAKAHISNTVQDKTTVERIMQAITGDKDKSVKSKSKGNTKKSTRRVY